MKVQAHRYHDFCAGHRVVGHENKCAHLHGHNYRVTFYVEAVKLDYVGRVVDFSEIDRLFCQWIEKNWDHKMLFWSEDKEIDAMGLIGVDEDIWKKFGIVWVQFNPTAENMGAYLLTVVGPRLLEENGLADGLELVRVDVQETRKCGVRVTL